MCWSALFSLPYILRISAVEHHQEVLAFFRVDGFHVGEGYYGAVVFHGDGLGEFKRDSQFLT